MAVRAAAVAHEPRPTCPCGAATLADRADGTVVRHGDTVAKAHAPDTDPGELQVRLDTAARRTDVFVAPLTRTAVPLHGRLVSFWPYGDPVDPDDPDAAPWEAAATLLALLHRTPLTPGLPVMRGPLKAARAVARLQAEASGHPAVGPVLRAWSALPDWARGETPTPATGTVCHGDLHLGQLVRLPGDTGWRLIDVDDLGVGNPAWDLARPAAWFACGLLGSDEWGRFLNAYRAAGGPAVPADGDPWPALDVPARALTVQTAARMVTKALADGRSLDDVETCVVDACARMPSVPAQLTHQRAT
ncbi:aminoglycoside phosphotransferase family protein [Streptomyces sp. 15-116A]|uniref:phosphotransferase family protein n=1 Tax=Streptomyces sp. 15-116A TaxID=2259035 RepID=UPI0021B39E4E|nr:aminoglycoside phosphotransferase family protein [Streptomyces sp. 15-116A]MCT7357085.1 aminoglycoside phosphotransferase family protein [Streptomyces sp. 15-116A]